MADEITDEGLAELRRLHEAADRAPWFLVGRPWADDRAADTYAISGSPDPHAGTAVLQWCEVDEVTLGDGDDESSAWRAAEDKQRANLACAVAARNALPGLLARLERADARIATLERERYALAAWACAGCGARFAESVPKWMLDGVTRCSACADRDGLRARIATLERELSRWRGCEQVEGDYVCKHEFECSQILHPRIATLEAALLPLAAHARSEAMRAAEGSERKRIMDKWATAAETALRGVEGK